jgi:hypothetical protein
MLKEAGNWVRPWRYVFYECQSWNSLRLGTIGFDVWAIRLTSAYGKAQRS